MKPDKKERLERIYRKGNGLNMIKVLICEAGFGDGGSTAYLYSFLLYFDIGLFSPLLLFTHCIKGSFVDKIRKLGLEVVSLPNKQEKWSDHYSSVRPVKYTQIIYEILRNNVRPFFQILALIKKRKIDLVLLNQDVVFHFPTVLAAAMAGVPCVVRKGGVGTYQGKKLWKFLSRFPEAFVASSNAEYRFHIDSGFPYKRMSVIYEGADVTSFSPGQGGERIRKEFRVDPEKLIVGSISRIVDGKGHEDFIDAASLVLKEFSKAVFLIVGDGDEDIVENLKKQAVSLGIQDSIIFAGWRNDTADILNAIDVFVHCPNRWLEGMGIATLEALASAKPVVITDNWGLTDTTQDGYNGFVVPIGSKERIAEKVLLLLKDKQLRESMGMNSRKRALELFDLRKNIKAIEDVMQEALHVKLAYQ